MHYMDTKAVQGNLASSLEQGFPIRRPQIEISVKGPILYTFLEFYLRF